MHGVLVSLIAGLHPESTHPRAVWKRTRGSGHRDGKFTNPDYAVSPVKAMLTGKPRTAQVGGCLSGCRQSNGQRHSSDALHSQQKGSYPWKFLRASLPPRQTKALGRRNPASAEHHPSVITRTHAGNPVLFEPWVYNEADPFNRLWMAVLNLHLLLPDDRSLDNQLFVLGYDTKNTPPCANMVCSDVDLPTLIYPMSEMSEACTRRVSPKGTRLFFEFAARHGYASHYRPRCARSVAGF